MVLILLTWNRISERAWHIFRIKWLFFLLRKEEKSWLNSLKQRINLNCGRTEIDEKELGGYLARQAVRRLLCAWSRWEVLYQTFWWENCSGLQQTFRIFSWISFYLTIIIENNKNYIWYFLLFLKIFQNVYLINTCLVLAMWQVYVKHFIIINLFNLLLC